MRLTLLFTFMLLAGDLHAQGCVIEGRGEGVEVKLCQQNGNIPDELFRSGFCQPELPGQQLETRFVEHCPTGAFGICRNARVSNLPYRQDIHYYGVASDARFLRPACELASDGTWYAPEDD
jgi:hypothetical protein